jgi:galactonate dehydratase
MKIVALKTYLVPPRWLFLKIETDAGIDGWGEPVLEGRAATLATLIEEIGDFLVGRDPRQINDIWQTLYRNGCYRGGPALMSAISGVDHALWDILGKRHGAPVHALNGGAQRSRIKTYVWIGGDRPRDLVADALDAKSRGFRAVKMNVCEELGMIDDYRKIDAIVARLAELRAAVGDALDLAFDFHGRVHAPMARVLLSEVAPLRPIFVEDPVAPGQIEALAELARATATPSPSASACIRAPSSRRCSRRGRRRSSTPTPRIWAGSPRLCASARWPSATTSRSPPTARWGRSRSPPACRSTRSATTPCCRSRASASTTTRGATCSTI